MQAYGIIITVRRLILCIKTAVPRDALRKRHILWSRGHQCRLDRCQWIWGGRLMKAVHSGSVIMTPRFFMQVILTGGTGRENRQRIWLRRAVFIKKTGSCCRTYRRHRIFPCGCPAGNSPGVGRYGISPHCGSHKTSGAHACFWCAVEPLLLFSMPVL